MRAPLDVVIADELKDFVLGINRHLVIKGAVAKVECKPRGDMVSMGNLDEVSAGERLAFRSLEHQVTVKCSLGSMDRYRISGKRLCGEKERHNEEQYTA